MKTLLVPVFTFLSIATFGQRLKWIPFNWEGDTISGRYFDKVAITVPVTIGRLPHLFNMQLDLGAVITVLYGNSLEPYLDRYPDLREKLDSNLVFSVQGQKNIRFRDLDIRLGGVSFGKRDIGYFRNFGDPPPKDMNTDSMVNIGTLAPDLFRDSVLIIDYPHQRISVAPRVPRKFRKATFEKCTITDGRIKVPFTIGDKKVDLLFDTGSSLFSLMTTKTNALQITTGEIVDSLEIATWGDYFTVYGSNTVAPILFAQHPLPPARVYFDGDHKLDLFNKTEKIWGITGNAYFLDKIVIIDYRKALFGVL